jgi:Carbohydrate-selective porin, OprB family/S-layer homology domain
MSFNKVQLSWLVRPAFACLLAGSSVLLAGTAKANEVVDATASAPVSTASTNLSTVPSDATASAPAPTASTNLPAVPNALPGTFSTLVTDVNSSTEAGQVTSVSQLSDVQPTDWAFQALQSLVERYGCIAGYPDGTFRGNRAATRYELAAALNACLDQISDRFATKEDLATVKALQEEFKAELATLKGRVDGLEARTKVLEAQQFSTTTKLTGEVIFAGSEVFTDNDKKPVAPAPGAAGIPSANLNARFFSGYRARLNFDTSFTGQDKLRVRLQARDTANISAVTGNNFGRLGFDGSTGGTFELDDLWYKFPIGKNTKVTVIAKSGEFNDFVGDTFNPYLSSSANGALSRFGRFNPLYRFADSGITAGVVVNQKINDQFAISAGYLAPNPTNSTGTTGGLFGGSYSALAQLEVKPFKSLGLGLTYVHSFQEAASGGTPPTVANAISLAGGTGSSYANNPFGAGANRNSSDSVGLEFTWKTAPWMNISGWAGVTFAEATRNVAGAPKSDATILNWAVAFAFPDLLIPGNLGALIVGQEPTVIGGTRRLSCGALGSANSAVSDCGSNFHLEALYKFKINGNVSVTPGLIVILNPQNNEANPVEFVPVVRTTFTF